AAAGPPPRLDGEGGPDGFGYRWIDSDAPDGPQLDWHDGNSSSGLVSGDEAVSAPIRLPFAFPYYGQTYDTVFISSNGYLSFTDPRVQFANRQLPSPIAPAAMIAPRWDDFITRSVRIEFTADVFVVVWDHIERFRTDGRYWFEVLLYPNGEIRFQYRDMGTVTTSATIGIQNADRTTGLTVAADQVYVHPGLAVR